MEVANLYENILYDGIAKIKNQEEIIDDFIENPKDTRMGIALLIRPPKDIRNKIENIESKIKEVEENQYYYPQKDLHITLLDITTARQNFKYTTDQVNTCIKLTEKVVKSTKQFKIIFKGLVLSDGAIMVKGYYENEMELMRQKLRKAIIDNNMKLDERYTTISSHITISRFKHKLEHRNELIKMIEKYKNYYFGKCTVSEIELIYHNWYDSKKEVLKKYIIK